MSNPFLDLVQQQLNDDNVVQKLDQQVGVADPEKTRQAADGISAMLTNALSKQASTPEGQNRLNSLLAQFDTDGDGDIMDEVQNLMSSGKIDGMGIVNQLLGGKSNNAIGMISQMVGLDSKKTGGLMSMVAPMLLNNLMRSSKQQGGLDISGIANMLTQTVSQQKQQGGTTGALDINSIMQFMDSDGDGIPDSKGMGGLGKLFGGLFGRK